MPDFYDALGISRAASQEEIAKAYREAALKYHPDRNPNDAEATKNFKKVAEAFETLGDPNKRRLYDSGGYRKNPSSRRKPHTSGFPDFFTDFFNQGHGANKIIHLEVEFMEAINGCQKEITVDVKAPCRKCHGSGALHVEACYSCGGQGHKVYSDHNAYEIKSCPECNGKGKKVKQKCDECLGLGLSAPTKEKVTINIPAGIDRGMQIRVPNMGEPGKRGYGSLFVAILPKAHDFFKREGNNILATISVTFGQLVFGTEVSIKGIKSEYKIKIPQNTKPTTKFRIPGAGIGNSVFGAKGDMIISLNLEMPKNQEYLENLKNLTEFEDKYNSDYWNFT